MNGRAECVRSFPADVNCLGAVQDFVRNFLTNEADVADSAVGSIELAVEEIFVNVALYAYKESETGGEVSIRCFADPDVVSLEFSDGGVPFNPLEQNNPDITLSAEEREPGGLGIFLVKKIMNVIEYRREDGKNVLYMSRKEK
jgi:sigma-B regulation protein RsbU (phosphoserine phosphatase)